MIVRHQLCEGKTNTAKVIRFSISSSHHPHKPTHYCYAGSLWDTVTHFHKTSSGGGEDKCLSQCSCPLVSFKHDSNLSQTLTMTTVLSEQNRCNRTRDTVYFIPHILLLCQNLAPILPTMQPECQLFGQRFRYHV